MIRPSEAIRSVTQPVSPVVNRQTPSKKDQLANVSVVPPRTVKGGVTRPDAFKRPTTGPSKKDQLANVSVVPEGSLSGPSKADQVRSTNYSFTPQSPVQQAPANTSQEPSQNSYASQMQGLVRQADRDRDIHTSSILRQAQESAVRGGYAPGTAGYDQLMEKASADAATAGMEIRQSVNQPLVSAMGKDLDRQYAEQDMLLGQYAEDPQAMEYIGSQLAQGKSIQDAITSMYDDEGNRLEQYKPKTDSQLARDALIDSTLQMKYGGRSLEELTPEERQEIERTSASLYDAMYQPVTTEVDRQAIETGIQENIREGKDFKSWSNQEINTLLSQPELWKAAGISEKGGDDLQRFMNFKVDTWDGRTYSEINKRIKDTFKPGETIVIGGALHTISDVNVKKDTQGEIGAGFFTGKDYANVSITTKPVGGGAPVTVNKQLKAK